MNDLVQWLREQVSATQSAAEGIQLEAGWTTGFVLERVDQYAEPGFRVNVTRPHHDAAPLADLLSLAGVLAQCEAHTAILDLHSDQHDCIGSLDSLEWPPRPCPTLRALASAYQHRPGYREEWRP
jgi:hypothetical protein